jgi:hypothetical protein
LVFARGTPSVLLYLAYSLNEVLEQYIRQSVGPQIGGARSRNCWGWQSSCFCIMQMMWSSSQTTPTPFKLNCRPFSSTAMTGIWMSTCPKPRWWSSAAQARPGWHAPGSLLGAPWKWLTATSTWAPCSTKPNSSSKHRSSWQQLVSQRALYALKSMCCQQDITDPSLRLHFWQQLVLPVVSFGSELWAGLYPFCDDASYMANNPSEQVHMQFLRWYLRARGSTHKHILLHAAHRLPLMQHWLQRTVQATLEQTSKGRCRHLAGTH